MPKLKREGDETRATDFVESLDRGLRLLKAFGNTTGPLTLSDVARAAGLPRATALALAAQTVRGAAEMVLSGGEHPAVLKDRVTSPAGTTIAGLEVLEKAGVRGALMGAVAAAARRSAELSGVS